MWEKGIIMQRKIISFVKYLETEYKVLGYKVFHINRSKHLTGHCHYMSPYEQDDICGNCNGVNCDRCKEFYETSIYLEDKYIRDIWIKARIKESVQHEGFNYLYACTVESHLQYNYIGEETYWEDVDEGICWEIEWVNADIIEKNYPDLFNLITTEVYSVYINGNRIACFKNEEKAKNFFTDIHTLYNKNIGNDNILVDHKDIWWSVKINDSYTISLRNEYLGNNKYILPIE